MKTTARKTENVLGKDLRVGGRLCGPANRGPLDSSLPWGAKTSSAEFVVELVSGEPRWRELAGLSRFGQ